MATVKYTGPIASFHCPTDAEIRHLKVHFTPKQEGTGDPSPENVRPIVGWDEVEVTHTGKNLFDPSLWYTEHGVVIDSNKITVSQYPWIERYNYYRFPATGYAYIITFKCKTLSLNNENATVNLAAFDDSDNVVGNTGIGLHSIGYEQICSFQTGTTATKMLFRNWGYNGSIEITDFRIELNDASLAYESYSGKNISYQFGTLGKNKVQLQTNTTILNQSTGWSNTNIRDMESNALYVNISSNNYWNGQSSYAYVNSVFDGGLSYHASNGSYGIGKFVSVAPSTTYVISYTTENENVRVRVGYYDKNGAHTNKNILVDNGVTFTTDSDTYYILLVFTAKVDVSADYSFTNLQLELGSTATAYEPYNPNKTVYGGWVDLITGEVCEEYIKYHVDSSKTIRAMGRSNTVGGNYYLIEWLSPRCTLGSGELTKAKSLEKCTHFKIDNPYTSKDLCIWAYDASTYSVLRMGFPDEYTINSVDDFKDWLDDIGGMDICYPITTPITYHIAPTALQTFLGQNNVWSNADYVEVEYDLHETQTILERKQYILANQPHIITAQDKLVNFRTDLAAPLKECKVYFEPKQDLHGYGSVWIGGNGKNLFNVNALEQNPSDTMAVNTTQRIFTPGTYSVGGSWSNWWQASQVHEYSISDGQLFIKNSNVYGVCFAFHLTPEATYTISATVNNGNVHVVHYDDTGTVINPVATQYLNNSFNVPTNAEVSVLVFFTKNTGSDGEGSTFSNIQLELGSTATSYAPYENICPIEGWNNLSITHNNDIVFKPIEETRTETYRNVSVENIPNGIRVINTNNNSYNCAVWYAPCSDYVNKQLKISLTCDFTGGGAGRLYVTANAHDGSTLQSLVQSTITKGQPFREWTIIPPDGTEYLRICLFASDVETMGYGKYTDYINMYITPIENIPQIIPIKFPTLGKNKFNPNIEWTVGTPYRYAYLPELEQECVMSFTLKDSTIDISDVSIGFAYSKPTSSAEANKGYRWCMSNGVIKTYEKINRVKETNDTSNIDKLCTYIMIISNTDDAYSRLLAAYDIQIEYGSTPTTYEPYNDTIYGGYVDLLTGEIWKTWHKISVDENTPFRSYVSDFRGSGKSCNCSYWLSSVNGPYAAGYEPYSHDGFCDKLVYYENNYAHNNRVSVTNSTFEVGLAGTKTQEEFLAWMAKNSPITICYRLAKPSLVTTLTPTQLKSLKGVNNIWSDANGNVEVSYWSH